MAKKAVCPHCAKALPSGKKRIGIPLSFCTSCGKLYVEPRVCEYALTGKLGYFYSFPVMFFCLLITGIVFGALWFFSMPMIALCSILLIPLLLLIFLGIKKGAKGKEILNSKKRCEYAEYLQFLSSNGFNVPKSAIQRASKHLDETTLNELFNQLGKSDAFIDCLAPEVKSALTKKTDSTLIMALKKEAQEKYDAPEFVTKKASEFTPHEIIADGPEFRLSDISSVERYINFVLKKYDLKCNESRFQTIKIDLISYLEENAEPDRKAIKQLIFANLRD